MRTRRRLAEELPELLSKARESTGPTSLRALAEATGMNQSYLSRILGAKGSRPVSKDAAAKIASAFKLPADYFPEYRAAAVIEAARADPALLDRVYDDLRRT
jgi:transcriptional regulator with XRE-family HTH domain